MSQLFTPGESGLVSRGSQGLRSPLESRRGSLGEVTQSCPTLRDPMVWSLPGSSIHGIFQSRLRDEIEEKQKIIDEIRE